MIYPMNLYPFLREMWIFLILIFFLTKNLLKSFSMFFATWKSNLKFDLVYHTCSSKGLQFVKCGKNRLNDKLSIIIITIASIIAVYEVVCINFDWCDDGYVRFLDEDFPRGKAVLEGWKDWQNITWDFSTSNECLCANFDQNMLDDYSLHRQFKRIFFNCSSSDACTI